MGKGKPPSQNPLNHRGPRPAPNWALVKGFLSDQNGDLGIRGLGVQGFRLGALSLGFYLSSIVNSMISLLW